MYLSLAERGRASCGESVCDTHSVRGERDLEIVLVLHLVNHTPPTKSRRLRGNQVHIYLALSPGVSLDYLIPLYPVLASNSYCKLPATLHGTISVGLMFRNNPWTTGRRPPRVLTPIKTRSTSTISISPRRPSPEMPARIF